MHKTFLVIQSLLLIPLLLVSTNTVAQIYKVYQDEYNVKYDVNEAKYYTDTTYLNEYNVKCAMSEAKYYRVFKKITEGFYQQNEYYLATNTIHLCSYCYRTDTPKLQGHCIYYTENGKMSSQGNYKDGLMYGKWTSYYPDTNAIWFTTTYEEGTPVGKLESYYLSGKLKRVQTYKNKRGKATGKCYDEAGQKIPFTPFEIMPVAGYSIPNYLKKTMTYPDNSRNHNIEGRIIIRFKIDTTGAIKEAKVVKSLSPETDAEALRAVVNMPPWLPGIQDDKKVEVFFHLPIVYKLD